MKYTIEGFGQEYALTLKKTIIEKGKEKTIKIDCIDLIILRWFVDFYPNMAKVEIDGVQYAWINYKSLLDDMPLLDMGKHMLANRLQKLCEFGILTHKTIKHGGSFSYYGFGSNYRNLIERPSAIDAQGMQKNADGVQNIADGMQNNADPCTINCTTPIQFIADPYAKNCITNNSSTKDPSSKDPSSKDREKATSRFIPPTAREVHDYCQEKGYQIAIDNYTQNQDVKDAIIEYIKMRKLIKAPMTDRALTTLLNKLSGLAKTDNEKIAVLNQAIEHSWKSVYPLEKQKPQQKQEPAEDQNIIPIEEYFPPLDLDEYLAQAEQNQTEPEDHWKGQI